MDTLRCGDDFARSQGWRADLAGETRQPELDLPWAVWRDQTAKKLAHNAKRMLALATDRSAVATAEQQAELAAIRKELQELLNELFRAGWVVASAPSGEDATDQESPQKQLPPARHSLDYRSVHWYGQDYFFKETQANVVKLLWEEWEKGTPDVGHRTLLSKAGSDQTRLQDVFKEKGMLHPAWGTMIQTSVTSKGSCRLQPPA